MGNETIIFGGGCFWCTEAVFEMLKGVTGTEPGYAGGSVANPTYEKVCEGTTGHAEVLRIQYNPDVISLDKLLEIFFAMHDPTQLNRQGADVGTQYRSIILFNNGDQREVIERAIPKIQKEYDKPIVTEVKRLDKFYPAEGYHRNYYDNNPFNPYCSLVIGPKIAKVKKKFAEYLKAQKIS
ncbi:MAG: peptide-methionine (S)-S-oxide reductase MsrA [Candidatus Micrarchaeota archaeon]|nr:peptide-methionine (S)-S-oxide reductase MsrA [Candidatus Micrarchaeota archaeon]